MKRSSRGPFEFASKLMSLRQNLFPVFGIDHLMKRYFLTDIAFAAVSLCLSLLKNFGSQIVSCKNVSVSNCVLPTL